MRWRRWLGPWVEGWQRRADDRAVSRRPIPDDLWKRTLKRYPFLRRRDPADEALLKRMASLFLDRKEFTAVGSMRLSNDVVVAIAAQACLPVLKLGLDRYDGFVGIIVQPDQVVARREVSDEDGVVHVYDEVLSGEAMQGGPLMLSWRDVRTAGSSAALGYNVVIHEFAHLLDMAEGGPDGTPALPPDLSATEWQSVLEQEFEQFGRRVELGDETALDPYGAEAPEEFFAVASEAFFVSPGPMRDEHPALYDLFVRLYRQDPLRDMP